MSSNVPSDQLADSPAPPSKFSPTILTIVVIGAIFILGVLYWWIRTPEPPCSTCHIEKRTNERGVEECWLNGRIRPDWDAGQSPLFAMAGIEPLKDPADENGYGSGECLDVPVECPKEELAAMELNFFNQNKYQVWSNPLCVGACPHCP